jgi:hypothetical protein
MLHRRRLMSLRPRGVPFSLSLVMALMVTSKGWPTSSSPNPAPRSQSSRRLVATAPLAECPVRLPHPLWLFGAE